MSLIHPNLNIGSMALCVDSPDLAVLHACKSPCHQRVVGYGGSLPKSHPNYLMAWRGKHLVLNLIDPPLPLFQPESFEAALDWLDDHVPHETTIVHCNNGLSRAPSIALLWLAKRAKTLPDGSFAEAREAFSQWYAYEPGAGITTFLTSHWGDLR